MNKKILCIILPTQTGNHRIINNIHKKLCVYFNFNIVDMQKYYTENMLEEFGNTRDCAHQLNSIMCKLGESIAENINNFIKIQNNVSTDYNFYICQAHELLHENKQQNIIISNSMYNENVIQINEDDVLKFPSKYTNMQIVAIHTWNYNKNFTFDQCLYNFSNIYIKNQQKYILKSTNFLNSVVELQENFTIDNNTYITCSMLNNYTEFYTSAINWSEKSIQHNTLSLVSFLLRVKNGTKNNIDFKCLEDMNIQIPQQINCNYLIPDIAWCKKVIDEYCSIVDSRKLNSLQYQIKTLTDEKKILFDEKLNLQNQVIYLQGVINSLTIEKRGLQISNLEQDLLNNSQLSQKLGVKMNSFVSKVITISLDSAKSRIRNQLSYKLGQAMIANSKSLLGYIRMPFALSYIKDKHKQEQKIYQEKIKKDPSLKLPPLEDYPDYKEALKEKECLTYRLGQTLIKADQEWYKGGYVKMWFEIRKLKKEYKKK